MITAHEWLAAVSGWWPSAADHLWQSTLFGIIVLGACMALRRGPARLRHSLWLVAALKFLVPVGLFVFLAERAGITRPWALNPSADSQLNALLSQGINGPVTALANSYEITVTASSSAGHYEILCAIALVWVAGALAFLGVWGVRRNAFLRALKSGRRLTDGREWQALERARKALRWRGPIEMIISPGKTDPAVCRVWRPVVVLPQSIADHLDDAELDAIMFHEVVHIKRRDNLAGNIQMVICALLWFHPLVWLISSRLFDERELACDEEVLKLRGAPEVYASSILKVVRFSLGWRVAGVTGAGSGSNLRRRIENIMSTNNHTRGAKAWHRLLATSVLSLAVVLMIIAGVKTQARDANANTTAPPFQEISSPRVANVEVMAPTMALAAQSDKQAPLPAKPATPPIPPQAAAPPAPSTSSNEAMAAAPVAPVAPVAPTLATSATPPSPAAAPAPPAKEKTKSKDKDKQKDAKRKVEKGGLIEAPKPVYPPDAKEQKIEGVVSVDIVINEEGNVISAKPNSGPEALHGAAKDAALKARFKPTLVDGKAAKVAGAMSYNFVLDEK